MAAIPFVDLREQYARLENEMTRALGRVFERAVFVDGPEVAVFESAFADYCQVPHCVSVHSGTAALHLALMALGIGPGDEVITVPNTFIATVEAISFVGAHPVFVDADPVTRTLDVTQLAQAVTPRTRALIPVHLYGLPADMGPITDFANEHGLFVIEDACQAHGAMYQGRPVGTWGDVGCFSFYPGKNLGAAGDGGAVVTKDPDLADAIRLLRAHGAPIKYQHERIGHNFRLDTLQAAILNVKLPHLPRWTWQRQQLASRYTEALAGLPGVVTPTVPPDRTHVFHVYAIEVENRLELMRALDSADIQYGIHYPKPVHLQPAYAQLGLAEGSYPVAERLSRQLLSLPLYPELAEAQQDQVIAVISSVCQPALTGVA
jgi:dTDP-4-amino-4,6-dideoxygalactose transaminase